MADKDLEISSYKEKVQWLEDKLTEVQNQLDNIQIKRREDLDRINKEKKTVAVIPQKNTTIESKKETNVEENTCHSVSFSRDLQSVFFQFYLIEEYANNRPII